MCQPEMTVQARPASPEIQRGIKKERMNMKIKEIAAMAANRMAQENELRKLEDGR